MQIVRTIALILVFIGITVFAIYNWKPVEVTLWENLVMETKLPVLVVLAFLVGFVPAWAYHQSIKWGLKRRVRSLEQSLKTAALARQNELHAQNAADVASDDVTRDNLVHKPAHSPVDSPMDKAATKPGDPLGPDAIDNSGATS